MVFRYRGHVALLSFRKWDRIAPKALEVSLEFLDNGTVLNGNDAETIHHIEADSHYQIWSETPGNSDCPPTFCCGTPRALAKARPLPETSDFWRQKPASPPSSAGDP